MTTKKTLYERMKAFTALYDKLSDLRQVLSFTKPEDGELMIAAIQPIILEAIKKAQEINR